MSHKSKSHPATPATVTSSRSLHLYGLELTFEATSVFETVEQQIVVDVVIDDVEEAADILRITRIVVDGVENTGNDLSCSDAFLSELCIRVADDLNDIRMALS